MLLVQVLNPQAGYIANEKSLLTLDILKDIYALAIHNIKPSRDRQEKQFMTFPVPEFLARHKVLIRNYKRDVSDPKYDVAYHRMHVMGWQLELLDESGKI